MIGRDRLVQRARTDWRRILAYLLLAGSVSAALYFGISTKVAIERRPAPCVDTAHGPKIDPSKGCERLAKLLLQTCILNPSVCRQTIKEARRGLSRAGRRRLDRLVQQLGADQRRAPTKGRRGGSSGSGGRGDGGGQNGSGDSTGGDGSGGAPDSSGDGSSGGAPQGSAPGASPAGRPSASDVVNGAVDDVRGVTNDAAEAIGGGRPLGPLPQVPQTPPLPDLLPELPCLVPPCARPP